MVSVTVAVLTALAYKIIAHTHAQESAYRPPGSKPPLSPYASFSTGLARRGGRTEPEARQARTRLGRCMMSAQPKAAAGTGVRPRCRLSTRSACRRCRRPACPARVHMRCERKGRRASFHCGRLDGQCAVACASAVTHTHCSAGERHDVAVGIADLTVVGRARRASCHQHIHLHYMCACLDGR